MSIHSKQSMSHSNHFTVLARTKHRFPPRTSLLYLPASVQERIFRELDECSLKNLSLTCSRFLLNIERTFQYAPKLHVSDRTNQVTSTVRIITESKEGQLFEIPIHPLRPTPVLYKTYRLEIFQPNPPTYEESSTQTQPSQFRCRRQLNLRQEKMWLCPHTACTLRDLDELPFAGYFSTRDTVLAACMFPKCAVWARHAVVETWRYWRDRIAVQELCSVLKAYRIRYSDDRPKSIRQMLTTISRDQLDGAMKSLRMPICRHLELGSCAVTDVFDPEQIPIFAEARDCQPFFSPNIHEGICESCLLEGTYTTWGFWARITKSELDTDGASWIDIEMTLSRPYHSLSREPIDDVEWISDPHWRAHCLHESNTVDLVDGWWKWAERVAEEGFDWRARLPTRFLESNKSALINFPQLPPPYKEYDSSYKKCLKKVLLQMKRYMPC